MYLRIVKVRSSSGTVNEYVRVVEAYRDNGKVKQRTVADLGRKDLLAEIFPKLQRLLGREDVTENAENKALDIIDASTWGPILAVRALFDELGLWSILDATLGKAKGVPFADRAFVLIANRLTRPASEHGLATLVESVSPYVRAMLALFCYRRSHLHALALSVASSCSERDLVNIGR